MGRLGCNGFSLFAEQMRPSLEEARGRELGKLNELISAAGPFWQALSEEEKRLWKERARHFKRSDNYSAGKKRRLRSARSGGAAGRPKPRKPQESDLAATSDAVEPLELPGPLRRRRPGPLPSEPFPPTIIRPQPSLISLRLPSMLPFFVVVFIETWTSFHLLMVTRIRFGKKIQTQATQDSFE